MVVVVVEEEGEKEEEEEEEEMIRVTLSRICSVPPVCLADWVSLLAAPTSNTTTRAHPLRTNPEVNRRTGNLPPTGRLMTTRPQAMIPVISLPLYSHASKIPINDFMLLFDSLMIVLSIIGMIGWIRSIPQDMIRSTRNHSRII